MRFSRSSLFRTIAPSVWKSHTVTEMTLLLQRGPWTHGLGSHKGYCARAMGCLFVLGLVCVGSIAQAANQDLPIHYSTIVAGLDYAHFQTTNNKSGDPWSIHIARVDRTHKELRIAE